MRFLKSLLTVVVASFCLVQLAIAQTAIRDDSEKITASGTMWDDYEYGRPGLFNEYFNYFFEYTAGDWTKTETETGQTGDAQALTDASGGVFRVTTDNNTDEYVSLQLGAESFLPTSSKDIFCETYVSLSDATNSDFFFGLSVTDNDLVTGLTYGLGFRKDDDDTNWDFVTTNNSASSTENAIATAVAATFIKLGFKITGTSNVEYWVNGTSQGSFDTNIPVTEMRPGFQIQSGASAATKYVDVDYINCAQEI